MTYRVRASLLPEPLSVDNERLIKLTAATNEPIYMASLDAYEVLDINYRAVNLSRVSAGAAPLLFNHDANSLIGTVELAYAVESQGKLFAEVRLADTERGKEVQALVKDGILRSVSIGYSVDDYERAGSRDGIPVYRVSRWTLYEVSLVTIPADPGARVGRFQEVQFARRMAMSYKAPQAAPQGSAPELAALFRSQPARPNHCGGLGTHHYTIPIQTKRSLPPEYAALVGTSTLAGEPVLRPADLLAALPIRVMDGLVDDFLIPIGVSGASTYDVNPSYPPNAPYPLDNSFPSIPVGTPTRPTFRNANVKLTPHNVSALSAATEHQLRTSNALDYILDDLSAAISNRLSHLLINGDGEGGNTQPTGVRFTPGINDGFASELSVFMLGQLERSVIEANGNPASMMWLCSPDILEALRQSPMAPGYSEPVLSQAGDILLGHRLVTTNHMTPKSIMLADWSQVVVGFWGDGATLLVNPYGAGFWSATSELRIMVDFDIAVLRPECVARAQLPLD